MQEIDKGFCVYLHISNNGDVFYVGQGRHFRAHYNSRSGRAAAWDDYAKGGFDSIILYDNLTKEEAVDIEKRTIISLRHQGHPLVNKSLNNGVRTLTKEMFEDYFEVCREAKYGLKIKFSNKAAYIGRDAGSISNKTGYSVVTLHKKQYFAHRVVYALVHGLCPSDKQVNHIDGNKLNNRPENLELVTAKENARHAHNTGLITPRKGEDNHAAFLTEGIVLEIYDLFMQGWDNDRIADKYDMTFKHVSLLRNGKRWKHLYKEYGKRFPSSKKEMAYSKLQVKEAWELCRTTDLLNIEISNITGIERSQVSRIRWRKCYLQWLDEFEKEVNL